MNSTPATSGEKLLIALTTAEHRKQNRRPSGWRLQMQTRMPQRG